MSHPHDEKFEKRESSDEFYENYSHCIKLLSISQSIDIHQLLSFLNDSFPFVMAYCIDPKCGRVTPQSTTVKVNNLNVYVRFSDRMCVTRILSGGAVMFQEFKLCVKGLVKRKMVNASRLTKKQMQCKNEFPSDRIDRLIACSDQMKAVVDWFRRLTVCDLANGKCVEQYRTNVLWREMGLDSSSMTSNDQRSSLFWEINCVSDLLLMEVYPYPNSEYLANRVSEIVKRLDLYSKPFEKQWFIDDPHLVNEQYKHFKELNHYLESKLTGYNPDAQMKLRTIIINRFNEICQNSDLFKHLTAYCYGSSATDYCRHGSDLDVTLIGDDYSISTLEQFKEMLDPEEFPEKHISSGMATLLKLILRDNTMVDLSFGHELGLANTQLLQTYSYIDSRVKYLILLVKSWAKSRGLNQNCAGYISSYAFCLMCIYYLQKRSILPNLQDLVNHPQVNNEDVLHHSRIKDFDCRFVGNVAKVKQVWRPALGSDQLSIAHLFFGFFQFYSNFDFSRYIISVRVNDYLESEEIAPKSRMGMSDFIRIEDPFELRCLGKFGTTPRMHRIQTCARETFSQLLVGDFEHVIDLKEEQHVPASDVSDEVKGQLLVSNIEGSARVVGENESVTLSSLEGLQYLHGDLVVAKQNGEIVKQIDEKLQLITGIVHGSDLISIDSRFPDAQLPNGALFGMTKTLLQNCDLLMVGRRLYPWKAGKPVRVVQQQLFGYKLDMIAQIRSVIHANFSNNYYGLCEQEEIHSRIVSLSCEGVPSDLVIGIACNQQTFSVYLPASVSSTTSKVVVTIPVSSLLDESREVFFTAHAADLSSSALVPFNEAKLDDAFSELFNVLDQLERKAQKIVGCRAFCFDELGYPISVTNTPSFEQKIYQILTNYVLPQCDPNNLIARQYVNTMQQINDIHLSYFIFNNRHRTFEAVVKRLNTLGLFSITLEVAELQLTIECDNTSMTDRIFSVTADDMTSVRLHHNSGKTQIVHLGASVRVLLDVDSSALKVPLPICVRSVED